VLIAVMNVKFHLFQKLTGLFTVVIVLEKINLKIMNMRNFLEMTEGNQEETTHVVLLEILEMTDEPLEMTDTLEAEENLQQ